MAACGRESASRDLLPSRTQAALSKLELSLCFIYVYIGETGEVRRLIYPSEDIGFSVVTSYKMDIREQVPGKSGLIEVT